MNSIEIFAGAGGLGLGVSAAGFKPLAVVERDRECCKTIRNNRSARFMKDWPLFEGDVRKLNFSEYAGRIALVAGGPPCQPFSLGGKHQGPDDQRDMFPEAARVVRETRPQAFLFENVKGLTRSTFATYLEYIVLQLSHPEIKAGGNEGWEDHLRRLERHHTAGRSGGLRYNVVYRVLNAANYGVPQRRERIFIVGFRSDLEIEWNFPPETHSATALLWSQCRSGDYWKRHVATDSERSLPHKLYSRANSLTELPLLEPWRTVRDAIGDLPDPEGDTNTAAILNHRFQPGARIYKGHTGSPYDSPAKTIKAGDHGVPGGENMLLRPDGSVRYFSVREAARLQTFPDDFEFQGSWSETMRQLGNAVPVKLATTIAKNIYRHLKKASP